MGDTNEFIEIYNAGTTDVSLDGLEVDLINGATNMIYSPTPALTGTLAAGQYLVIATATLTGIDPAATVVLLPKAGDNVQNGAPDAILLRDTVNKIAIDAISYEGTVPPIAIDGVTYNLVSGLATAATDTGTVDPRSIVRYPNGADTNDDSVDWRGSTLVTPGAANQVVVEVCLDGMMLDEDADGLTDCADPDCVMFPACIPPEICDNNLDEDGDMMIDCADSDCDTKVCGMNGRTCTMNMCTCAGGMMEMTCDNMVDDDCDGMVDCNDADCSGTPACNMEICDNGLDEDGDMMIDCADSDCNMKACGMNGLTCNMNMCACPTGMTTEAMCNDMMDEDCDGMIDCADADCDLAPACNIIQITSVDYPVIAQGGTLVLTGQGFMGATGVTIGGTNEMFTVNSDTEITLTPIDDMTPMAMQNIIVTTPAGSSMPFGVTVIRLQINELDADTTPDPDANEFVEIKTGVPGVNLTGYTLVFWNGSNNQAYRAIHLNTTADANGLLYVGNTATNPPSMITFPNNTLQNGEDAVAIHQALPAAYPNTTGIAAATRIIDALVYETNDPDATMLINTLMGPGGVQVDETTMHPNSIQRCADGRRNGAKFLTAAPTLGMANTVTCP